MREIKKYARFYIQKRNSWVDKSPKRPRPVVMMFNYDGKRLCTLTGVKVAEYDWDLSKQRVKLSVKRASEVNAYIDRLEDKVNNIYYGALANGITPDNSYIIKELRNDKKPQQNKHEPLSIIGEWKRYHTIIKVNSRTLQGLVVSLNHFTKFSKGMRLSFDEVTPELMSKYASYLQKLGHGDNTVYKHIEMLKRFMNYAKKAGLHNNVVYKEFSVSQKEKRIIFLEPDELKALICYKPESSMDRKALDNFLFGCLTAMRYSDYHNLKRADISEVNFPGVEEGYYSIKYRQVKTGKLNIIPLLPEALEIIERNKLEKGDFALPRISNQRINDTIKDIARRAGIKSVIATDEFKSDKCTTKYVEKWQVLSTHIGRKTFISVAAAKGIPIHIVASIAGHTTKTCMKFYTGVADKDKFIRVNEILKFT